MGSKSRVARAHTPQSEADFVRETVEGIQRRVTDEMVCLCDRSRPPFALFVSSLVSSKGAMCGEADKARKIRTGLQTPTNLPPR
jgi:hypothetical protein